jgi:histidinol dehydrogenase
VLIRRVDLGDLFPRERAELTRRSPVPDLEVREKAARIVARVRDGGDGALHDCNFEFGGGLPMQQLRIDRDTLEEAAAGLDTGVADALVRAAENIRRAHEHQRPFDQPLEVVPGVRVDRRWSPLRRVGVYVPGGTAPYPSSLLMGVIPAQVAGVPEIVVVSPADENGNVSPAVLGAAGILGVDEFYVTGGAQAVAALAYGTETIRAVDKIVGPGNAYVAAAKLAVYGDCAIDLPAGPSEAVIVADETAPARLIAADLLCQAEHGPDSPIVLVTSSPALADAVLETAETLVDGLEREGIIRSALQDYGLVALAPTTRAALEFANEYAPEHLSIHTADAAADAELVPSAGSVFVGPWAPESAGDYATGANHVLPTGGLAAEHGPLSVEDFGSWRQVQTLTREGLEALRPTIAALAAAEGLTAHKLAVDIRFEGGSG